MPRKAEMTNATQDASMSSKDKVISGLIDLSDKQNELIFSTKVCQKDYDCDERINRMINESDFITEIGNTKIYYLEK